MNQGNILVNDQVLQETASNYRSIIANMRNLLDEATRNINSTSNAWTGGSAEELRMKYEKFKTSFEPFCEAVEQFSLFLDKSAEQYRANEQAVSRAAQDTISDVNIG